MKLLSAFLVAKGIFISHLYFQYETRVVSHSALVFRIHFGFPPQRICSQASKVYMMLKLFIQLS